jgi:hypothetical protein
MLTVIAKTWEQHYSANNLLVMLQSSSIIPILESMYQSPSGSDVLLLHKLSTEIMLKQRSLNVLLV